jgi:1-deoxy-D-xylulose-5-phosphate synthase
VKLKKRLAKTHTHFVTVEDNTIMGGAGSAVNECIAQYDLDVHVYNVGLPDAFLSHGSRDEVLTIAGLSSEAIKKRITKILRS